MRKSEMVATPDQVVAVLQRGKERLAVGWCRGMLYDPVKQAVCARGAIYDSNERAWWATPMYLVEPAEQALAATRDCATNTCEHFNKNDWGHRSPSSVVNHNNECVKDQAEMLDWFDRAIRHVKERP